MARIGPRFKSCLGKQPVDWLLQAKAIGISLQGLPSVVLGSLLAGSLVEGIQSPSSAIPKPPEDWVKAFKAPD